MSDLLNNDALEDDEDEYNFYESGDTISKSVTTEETEAIVEEVKEAPTEEGTSAPKPKIIIDDEEEKVPAVGKVEIEEDSSDDTVLTQEEQLRYFADSVMSAIVGGKDCSEYAIGKLISTTTPELFRDENFVIFSVYYRYRDRIKNINIDSEFLSLFLDNNRDFIEKSQNMINIHAYGDIDGSETLGYISGVVKHFNRLHGMDSLSEEEFNLILEKYTVIFKSLEAQKIYAQSSTILSDGLKLGKKRLVGFDDSFAYSRRRLADLEGLVDMNKGSGFTSMRDIIMGNKDERRKPIKIGDFGQLVKLNEIYGGIYTGNFYEVLAPTKGGKSKFCNKIGWIAQTHYGTNVTVWAHEGGKEAWTAQTRAIHFDYTYNGDDVAISDKKLGVNQDTILNDKFDNQDLRELEMASALDLASNPSYGNVDFIDRPFNVETFLDEIDTSVKKNNSKLIIVDYLQLIDTSTRMPERERVAKAYKDVLAYCKKNNVAFITPAQFKQDSLDNLSQKTDTSDAEMRTAGGGSAEVFRTPDIIFAFWASTVDLQNNKMKILSVPCRFNKPFSEIPCYIDLGVCKFVSLNE